MGTVLLLPTPLGDRLRRERLRRHLSQDALGERIGLSDGYISQIETGKKTPSPDTLRSIASALDLDVNEMAGLAGFIPAQHGDQTITAPAETAGILRRLIERYTPEELTAFERAMAALFVERRPAARGEAEQPDQGERSGHAPDADADLSNRGCA